MDAAQIATVITAVGTACAAIITAILAGSRWLLNVWFKYQLKVKAEEKKNFDRVMAELQANFDQMAKTLEFHRNQLENAQTKFGHIDAKLTEHAQRLEMNISKYQSNLENSNRMISAITTYAQKTEEWKKGIETQLVQLKSGNVMVRSKK